MSDGTYSLGLAEILSGSATEVLSTFQQILYDLELTLQSGAMSFCQKSRIQCQIDTLLKKI